MELQQIYYVLEVAKHRSFSKAAETLYVSQPSISRRISALEKELNVKLFIRDTHSVSLTRDGEAFCRYAETIADTLHAMKEHFHVNKNTSPTLIRIGVFPFYKLSPLRQIINDYRMQHQELSIDIVILDTHPALDMLEKGELDFVFAKEPISSNSNVKFVKLLQEYSYLLVKSGSLPGVTSIDMDMISNLSLHVGRKNTPSQMQAADYFQNLGISVKESQYDTFDADIILDLVRSGSTNVWVSESVASNCIDDDIDAIPIAKDIPISQMFTYLVYTKDKPLRGVQLAFSRYITESFQNFGSKKD